MLSFSGSLPVFVAWRRATYARGVDLHAATSVRPLSQVRAWLLRGWYRATSREAALRVVGALGLVKGGRRVSVSQASRITPVMVLPVHLAALSTLANSVK
jgi:hypothetical protein